MAIPETNDSPQKMELIIVVQSETDAANVWDSILLEKKSLTWEIADPSRGRAGLDNETSQ